MKRHFLNRLRLRDKQRGPGNSEIDQQLITSVHCAEETIIPELVFPATHAYPAKLCEQRPFSHGTQGTVREPPIRALHHSLSRLKDINTCTDVRCLKPFNPFLSLRASERIACEQALLFGRAERAWQERASQRQSCDGTPAFASPLACLLRVHFS